MAETAPGLEDDEPLHARMTVTFRGAIAANLRGLAVISGRTRMKAFGAWAQHADHVGFPFARPEMTLGATDRRLMVWRPSFWLGRPVELVGTVPYDQLAQVEVYRSGLAVGLVFVFKSGELIEVESMRTARMRQIRDVVRAHLDPF